MAWLRQAKAVDAHALQSGPLQLNEQDVRVVEEAVIFVARWNSVASALLID